jgi:hypothetical protein
MRLLTGLMFTWVCLAQMEPVKLPPMKTSVTLEGQPVGITVWGSVSPEHLSATVDLGGFQEHLTPILAAQLNRSERCGERLSVEKAALAPSGLLTATVHFERFGCAKALGKEIVKRLVGGNANVEVNLTPSVNDNHIAIAAEVRKIDADGSLGEMLKSGSFGDSIKQKIATSIESSIQKSANLKSTLPAGMEEIAKLQSIRFADSGGGGLWLVIEADLHLTAEQFQGLSKTIVSRR